MKPKKKKMKGKKYFFKLLKRKNTKVLSKSRLKEKLILKQQKTKQVNKKVNLRGYKRRKIKKKRNKEKIRIAGIKNILT